MTEAPFEGEYKTPFLGLRGTFAGSVELPVPTEPTPPSPEPPLPPPEPPYDLGELMAIAIHNQGIQIWNSTAIIQNQILDRIEYERNNPLINDNPCYDWAEETVEPGYQVTFTLLVPEGSRFFAECWNTSYNDDSYYTHTIDGVSAGTLPDLTQPLMDFGDIYSYMFRPPRIIQNHLILTAANLGLFAQTYSVFIRGFFRDSTKVDKEFRGAR